MGHTTNASCVQTYGLQGVITVAIMMVVLFAGRQLFSEDDAVKADSSSPDSADSQSSQPAPLHDSTSDRALLRELEAKIEESIEEASGNLVQQVALNKTTGKPVTTSSAPQPRVPVPRCDRIPGAPRDPTCYTVIHHKDSGNLLSVCRCTSIRDKNFDSGSKRVAFLFENYIVFEKELDSQNGRNPVFKYDPARKEQHRRRERFDLRKVEDVVLSGKTSHGVNIILRKGRKTNFKRGKAKYKDFTEFENPTVVVENKEWVRLVKGVISYIPRTEG